MIGQQPAAHGGPPPREAGDPRGPAPHGPAGPPPQSSPPQRAAGAPAKARIEAGQLVENIPRIMRVEQPCVVEVRIAKSSVKALAEGMQGGGVPHSHRIALTKAMAVRLRAPEGGFWIEPASPETQWIENSLGLMSDDYASWRWTITPRRRGRGRLLLTISARSVGADGLAAETALPDQSIEVRVRTNYAVSASRWGGWFAAAVAGGVLAKFGEGLFAASAKVVARLMAG